MTYYNRNIDFELRKWREEERRKPLLLRGARQVGKSSAVRQFAKEFEYFVEVNFENNKDVHALFEGNLNPKNICSNLSLILDTPIIPGKTLLFLDEIQTCIPAISALRFFYEEFPELHLIAAGSLLEFALEDLPSFGVGRVRSMFVYPFTFNEFLSAYGENMLLDAKKNANISNPLHEVIHEKLNRYLKQYLVIGGMPEAIATFLETKDYNKCQAVLDDLVISLKDDFSKYKKRVPSSRIKDVFNAVVEQQGGKFIYKKVTSDANHKQLKEAVELLISAGIVIPVTHSAANGLPLGAEIDHKRQKLLIFDTGIFQRILDLKMSNIILSNDFEIVNKGSIAELYTGLEILKASGCYAQKQLYYWHRENPNSNAEVDYVINIEEQIIPIEVKSGKSGSMQSMYVFLNEKNLQKGIRTSLENYSSYEKVNVVPLYGVSELFNN